MGGERKERKGKKERGRGRWKRKGVQLVFSPVAAEGEVTGVRLSSHSISIHCNDLINLSSIYFHFSFKTKILNFKTKFFF